MRRVGLVGVLALVLVGCTPVAVRCPWNFQEVMATPSGMLYAGCRGR